MSKTTTIEVGRDGRWYVVSVRGFGIPSGFWFRHDAANQVRGLVALFGKGGGRVVVKHSDRIGLLVSSHREGRPHLPCQ